MAFLLIYPLLTDACHSNCHFSVNKGVQTLKCVNCITFHKNLINKCRECVQLKALYEKNECVNIITKAGFCITEIFTNSSTCFWIIGDQKKHIMNKIVEAALDKVLQRVKFRSKESRSSLSYKVISPVTNIGLAIEMVESRNIDPDIKLYLEIIKETVLLYKS